GFLSVARAITLRETAEASRIGRRIPGVIELLRCEDARIFPQACAEQLHALQVHAAGAQRLHNLRGIGVVGNEDHVGMRCSLSDTTRAPCLATSCWNAASTTPP